VPFMGMWTEKGKRRKEGIHTFAVCRKKRDDAHSLYEAGLEALARKGEGSRISPSGKREGSLM